MLTPFAVPLDAGKAANGMLVLGAGTLLHLSLRKQQPQPAGGSIALEGFEELLGMMALTGAGLVLVLSR
ncbi:hypothetical protein [Synechococcus sp. RSCCF101]|uniref:hypothetical protein n=1 Tax=Synechococcus sp. RSCCF101 TaxID=2511069 RepID=UPI0012448477|nr:hypothetical protein [Synechococcus sp. RSCCF101]